jgi:hypothetical protein
MKTEQEIKEQIEALEVVKDHGEYQGSDVSEIEAKIVVLQWVLGIQSDIFN